MARLSQPVMWLWEPVWLRHRAVNQETMSSNSGQLGDLDQSPSLNPRKEALISQACQENCSSRNQH